MKKKWNALLIVGIIFSMVLSVVWPGNIAKAEESNEGNIYDYNEDYYDSYEEAVAAAEELANQTGENGISDEGESVDAPSDYIILGNLVDAGKYLRKEMVARKGTVYFTYKNNEGYDYKNAYFAIRDEAFKETGVYNEER